MDPLEKDIRSALVAAVAMAYAQPGLGTPAWTEKIYGALIDLGHQHGLRSCASHHEADHPEWLYDLLWYRSIGSGRDEHLTDVPMVMECEWHPSVDEIALDFEKLLVATAPLKVMICSPNVLSRAEVLAFMSDSVNRFQRRCPGDRYLIAFVREEARDVLFETLVVP